ncbi:MAG: hypothetical protein P8L45_07190, partial [Longimicrobiales bacterium]|nr:hypothetical protein [Longimicrobiales bacterium]
MKADTMIRSWRHSLLSILPAIFAAACTAPGPVTDSGGVVEVDHFVPSQPETVSWGWYPVDKEPVLTIQSGETVRINTLTHAGATQSEEPVSYLAGLGIPREEVLQDGLDFWASREGR